MIVNSHPYEGASGPFWGLVRLLDLEERVLVTNNQASSEQAGRPTLTPQAYHILGYQVSSPHQPPGWSLGHGERQTPAHMQWTKA